MDTEVSEQLDELIFGFSEPEEESELEKFFNDNNDSNEKEDTNEVKEVIEEEPEEKESTNKEVDENKSSEESNESEVTEEQDEVTNQDNDLRDEIRQLKIQITQDKALYEQQLSNLKSQQQKPAENVEIPQEEFIKSDEYFDQVITNREELNKILNQIVNHTLGHANKNIQYVITKIPEILETISVNNKNDEAAASQFYRDNKDILTLGVKTEADSINRRGYLKVLLNQIAAEGKITDRLEMLKEMGKRARAQLGIQESKGKQVNRTVKKVDLTKGKGSTSGKIKTNELANSLADEIEQLVAI